MTKFGANIYDRKREQIFMIEKGDLILVPFPFSDQSGRKVRPVIVISNNNFNKHSEDLIVVGVTSNISKDKRIRTRKTIC